MCESHILDSIVNYKNITLDMSTEITELEPNKIYRYWVIKEANRITHITNKEKMRKELNGSHIKKKIECKK